MREKLGSDVSLPLPRAGEAGREVGRHHIPTHAYWREAGEEFQNVNIMGVAHGKRPKLRKLLPAAPAERLPVHGGRTMAR